MTETLTVIVPDDPAAQNATEIATIHAETFPTELLDSPVHNVSCDTIVPYESDKATDMVTAALNETRKQVRTHLDIIYEHLADTDPADFADLLNDQEFRRHCLQVSSAEYNVFELYDGTGYHYGFPITTQDTIDDIEAHAQRSLYVARLSFER